MYSGERERGYVPVLRRPDGVEYGRGKNAADQSRKRGKEARSSQAANLTMKGIANTSDERARLTETG